MKSELINWALSNRNAFLCMTIVTCSRQSLGKRPAIISKTRKHFLTVELIGTAPVMTWVGLS